MCLPRFEEVEHFVFEKETLISLLRFMVGMFFIYFVMWVWLNCNVYIYIYIFFLNNMIFLSFYSYRSKDLLLC